MFLGTPHWHCTRSRWSQGRLRQPHQPALGESRGSQPKISQSCRRAHRNGIQASPLKRIYGPALMYHSKKPQSFLPQWRPQAALRE